MKVTILQRDILWADPATNIARADEAIARNAGSDLYVLPEMFSTGFCVEPETVAESLDGEALQWMKSKAAATNAAIAGSVVVTDGERYFNRFYFVKPDGEVEY
ncbi:MAG: nitrilase family protein, partial [Alistipes sp.]|nr:nitrilase family protein [Alistipes sp.]